jgi:hypothetical protein
VVSFILASQERFWFGPRLRLVRGFTGGNGLHGLGMPDFLAVKTFSKSSEIRNTARLLTAHETRMSQ